MIRFTVRRIESKWQIKCFLDNIQQWECTRESGQFVVADLLGMIYIAIEDDLVTNFFSVDINCPEAKTMLVPTSHSPDLKKG